VSRHSAEGGKALAEFQAVAAEAAHLRPPVAAEAGVLGQRHGDDESPLNVMRIYGISECRGHGFVAWMSITGGGKPDVTSLQ
jgi:hypothetical protein